MERIDVEIMGYSPLPKNYRKNEFKIKQNILSFTNKNRIIDGEGTLIGFSKQKLLSMKNELMVYKSEDMDEGLFHIKQKNLIDINASFEVKDMLYDHVIGYIGKETLESITRSGWILKDPDGRNIAKIKGLQLGVTRALKSSSSFNIYISNDPHPIGSMNEEFHMTKYEMQISVSDDPDFDIDRRLLISAALCSMALRTNY